MKRFWVLVWAVFLTLVVTRVYLHPLFPYTHDGENHLARFANYKVAIKEGQVPPRFAPNLVNHYGYPVFNYNYPLANILSVPFSFLKIPYEVTFKVLVIGAVVFAMGGVAVWVRLLGYSGASQVFAMIVYGLAPYLLSTIAFRGNIGEIFAYCLLPWVLVSLQWIRQQRRVAVLSIPIWSAFALSHNVTVFFAALLFIPHVIVTTWRDRAAVQRVGVLGVLSACLVAWFWLPALVEKNQIVLGDDQLAGQYVQHALTLRQALWGPLQFGYSYAAPIDTLGVGSGWLITMLLICSSMMALAMRRYRETFPVFWWGSAVFLIIAQLNWLTPIWNVLPSVQYIQFPWRLGIFVPVCTLPVAAWVWKHSTRSLRGAWIVLVGLIFLQAIQLHPVDRFTKLNRDYDAFSQSTSTANENTVKTFSYSEVADWRPSPIVIGDGVVDVQYWNGSVREYNVHANQPVLVIEPTMYFLGWQTSLWDNGRWRSLPQNTDSVVQGRIAVALPAGNHRVRTQFTQNTPARIVGHGLFFIGMGASMIVLQHICRKKHFSFF